MTGSLSLACLLHNEGGPDFCRCSRVKGWVQVCRFAALDLKGGLDTGSLSGSIIVYSFQ